MTQHERQEAGPTTGAGLLTVLFGIGMVVADVAAIFLLLATSGMPTPITFAGTAIVAVVIGGSFLQVLLARRGSSPTDDPASSTGHRLARVVVSITVLSGVTVLLGYGGGLLLWASANLGGPDPTLEDGDLLRDRLLDWPDRNREFMRSNGHGELPLRP